MIERSVPFSNLAGGDSFGEALLPGFASRYQAPASVFGQLSLAFDSLTGESQLLSAGGAPIRMFEKAAGKVAANDSGSHRPP